MLSEMKPAILMTLVLTVLTGLIYPITITGVAQVLFPHQANGSLILRNGRVIELRFCMSAHLVVLAFLAAQV